MQEEKKNSPIKLFFFSFASEPDIQFKPMHDKAIDVSNSGWPILQATILWI